MNLQWIKVLSICFVCYQTFAQDLARVQRNIDTLCSPSMFGRGYVKEGDKKAAQWLAQQFQEIGLLSFQKTYFQYFPLQINTFEKSPALKWGRKWLQLGIDYLPQASSGEGRVTASPYRLDEAIFSNEDVQRAFLSIDLRNKAILYPQEWQSRIMSLPENVFEKFSEAPLHIATTKKLTHTVSWQQTATPALVVLEKYAEKTPKKIYTHIQSTLKKGVSQNLIGYLPGMVQPDSFIVFTAHYDHLGGIGEKVFFPGANDNASGVAMLLELAHYFQRHPQPYSLVFIAFGGEEVGLIGSKYFVENPFFPLKNIVWVMNLDLTATGEKGATIVNGSVFKHDFDKLVAINQAKNYLPAIYARGRAANSDHYFFSEKGVKAFFLYLMGDWTHYHDIEDKPPLPLSRFSETFRLLVDFTEQKN